MKLNLLLWTLLLSLLNRSTPQRVCLQNDCPTWMKRVGNTSINCTCGDTTREIIKCDNATCTVQILDGYLVTYDEEKGVVEAGQAIYGWRKKYFHHGIKKALYYKVQLNRSKLNYDACHRFQREGRLCGRCREGYSPLVYSYMLNCINCSSSRFNEVKYIGAAFVPLTMFYLFVVFFKFNANSPALQAYILVAQIVGAPISCKYFIAQYKAHDHASIFAAFFSLLWVYGIWISFG